MQRLSHLGERPRQFEAGQFEPVHAELDALEEHALLLVVVLVGLGHVAAVTEDELGDGGYQAGAVGGGQ